MSDTKWTAGPWNVEDKAHGCGYGINGLNGEAVVWWAGPEENDSGIPIAADAHLIAAAPELYEALKVFADCCEQIESDEGGEEWAKFRLLIKNYRAAKAACDKARGE